MRIKWVLTLCAAAILLPAASDPPPALAPYFREGRFDPGDFGWMRGRFPDARPADVQTYATIEAWMRRCYEDGVARTREELAAMGIPQADLSTIGPRDLQCGALMMANSVQTGRVRQRGVISGVAPGRIVQAALGAGLRRHSSSLPWSKLS
ncbi:hypothetical protein [Sphingomonas pokkalii]|uniref:hypothetical protein n=1 Tax=Sphingomonas pokkalii TaxID=2175090 RepID=UPI001F0B915C|nr:hypothetical protein [Sphingomonas pokkalii]